MENENLVTDEVTENVEETTEQTNTQELTDSSKEETKGTYYTDEELDEKFADRYKRGKIRGEKEATRKYSGIVSLLKQGLEVDSLDEIEGKLSELYQNEGIKVVKNNDYDDDDLKYLATKDAEEIIDSGMMETELRRLADLGADKMTKREKVMFEKLHEVHTIEKSKKELAEIGVGAEVLESKDFKDFIKKLSPSLSTKEKYEMYEKLKPKEKKETMGSMSNNNTADNGIKDHYSSEEIAKLSLDDLKNPKVFEAVRKSMTQKG